MISEALITILDAFVTMLAELVATAETFPPAASVKMSDALLILRTALDEMLELLVTI